MHPINNFNFGPTGIQVMYNNGTAVVSGWIVKQLGSRRYIVTSDGVTMFTASLTSTPALNASLTTTNVPAGKMTIVVSTPLGTEYVKKIWDSKLTTNGLNSYPWTIQSAPFDGGIVVPHAPTPVTNLVLTSPSTGTVTVTFTSTNNDFLVQYFDVTASGSVNTKTPTPTASPVSLTSLTSGHVYSVSVSSMGVQGTSPAVTKTITVT